MPSSQAPDVAARLRPKVPALAGGTAFFDGPGGTQTPAPVADAIRNALTAPLSNRGSLTTAARNAGDIVDGCRSALGDLLGVDLDTVAFGRSMTALTFDLARALSRSWGPGDEVVVTRLDHDANVRPWLTAAERAGATVRWVDFDPETAELDAAEVAAVVGKRTRLVAVTAASNLLGTMPDIPAIAEIAHDVGALLYVDGVHYAPHAVVDVPAMGADLFACSPYKFLGPHCGAVTGRPELLAALEPDKLDASPASVPERFELGTLPYELMAGVTAAVDVIAGLGAGSDSAASASRRSRLVAGIEAVERHETELRTHIEEGLRAIDGVVLHARAERRTPTLLVSLAQGSVAELSTFLAERDVNAPAGHFYAFRAAERLGLGRTGGLRVGLAPYNDEQDVERLLDGVRAFCGTR
ncbi:cysteine desulfurase-like protein [Nocardioides sp. CBS4Y-1]|uniref:Cysteine desulfurase-like protein n=2 Tax=Nocardioides acrostichi TaxID=2784339 RepID=A0A930UW87_9ACTN|nr:cysteine desulfurase-like protein [Nocardioides acrostichi]